MKTIIVSSNQNKTYAKNLIDQIDPDGNTTVEIKKTAKDSTAKQRRLQWKWYTEVSLSGLGQNDTKEGVHVRAKWQFARPILLRDYDVFSAVLHGFEETIKHYDNDTKKEAYRQFSRDYISTEQMNRKQRAEYLTDFQRFWIMQGVELTDPDNYGRNLLRFKP